MKIKRYLELMRPKHYLKNFLIFLPLIFSGMLFKEDFLIKAALSFMAFSMVASLVYVVNDIKDLERDKLHPKKKNRPIASGKVSVAQAIGLCFILLLIAGVFQYFASTSLLSVSLLGVYLLINILYSFGLKNVPIVDVVILSLGFLIRIFYGGASVGIEVSRWLYLVVLAFSFYLGLGKRRNEIKSNGSKTRKVNQFYTHDFLDKNMYMCLTLTVIFYSLWTVDPIQSHKMIFWTVPLVMIIVMTYSLSIERDNSDGDPISVLAGNKMLILLVAIYGFSILGLIYF